MNILVIGCDQVGAALIRDLERIGHDISVVEAATEQILNRQYMEPFKADKRQVIGLGIELDGEGKGLLGWKRAE